MSDPAKFEVFPTYNSQFQVSLSYLYNFTTLESMKAEYCYSDTPLTYKELGKADWQIMEACGEMNPAPDAIMLSAEFCRRETVKKVQFQNSKDMCLGILTAQPSKCASAASACSRLHLEKMLAFFRQKERATRSFFAINR